MVRVQCRGVMHVTALYTQEAYSLLHWLPLRQHIDFMVATAVHWLLSGNLPLQLHLADVSSYCRCSWAMSTLHGEPSMRRYTDPQQLQWRAFAAADPGLWNSLQSDLIDADLSYSGFWQSLDIFCLDNGATAPCEPGTTLIASPRNNLTYLLTLQSLTYHIEFWV